MVKNKKFVFISTAVLIIIGIFFFFREKSPENNIWFINAFDGDKDNKFTERLQKEIINLLPSNSKIIIKVISEEISNSKQAEKVLKSLNTKLIVWGNIKNEKVSLNLTISKTTCAYIDIDNSIACLLDLKNIQLTDDIKIFNEDNKSSIKIFFQGYIKYLNREYKTAISIWENKFPDNPIISFYLGNAYLLLSQNGKQVKDNQLEARKYYHNIIQTVDKNTNLVFHQSILSNLGVHYLDYPFDLYSENIIKAQNYLEDAVKISPDWSNEEYGIALSNLAILYENLYFNSREKFKKLVIGNFSESLRVFREHNNKEMQAVTNNNLGISSIKIEKESNENIEESIYSLNTAKKLVSKNNQPEIFYRIINNLGLIYNYKSETKEATQYFIMSQEFFKEDIFPIQFALIQENIGNILLNMPRAPDEGNLLEAISCYENALRVLNQDNRPLNFAQINSNLGLIYSSLQYNNRQDNLIKAVSYYENALLVLKKDLYPLQYANLKNNLANIFIDLSALNGTNSVKNISDLLESAINYFTESLEIYKILKNSKALVMTKVNMANAYTMMKKDRKKNLTKAISIYMEVLSLPDGEKYYSFITNNLQITQNTLQNLENKSK